MNDIKKMKKPMTGKMLKFCEYYLETRTAVRSYAQAYGYDIDSEEGKEKHYQSCATNGYKLLQDERVKEYLEHRMLEMNYERDQSEKEILMLLNKIALGGQYKENTRMDAIKMLAKMRGMYDEIETEQQININLSSDLEDAIEKQRKPNPEPDID